MKTQVFKAFDQNRDVFRIRWKEGKTRRSIAWGGDEQEAETCRSHVEHLLDCHDQERPIQSVTLNWLDRLSDRDHQKLARKGLVEPRTDEGDETVIPAENKAKLTMKQVTDAFLSANASKKMSTVAKWKQAIGNLHRYFGESDDVTALNKQKAEDFREWLLANGNVRDKKGGTDGNGEKPRTELDRNTVSRRIGICRQIFKWAIESKLLTENPFIGLPAAVHANPERFFYVDERTTRRILEFANDPTMRAIIALNRLIGLRIPSEIQSLRWCDIDLSDDDPNIRILAPKTEHHRDRGRRTAPIIPNLRPFIEDLWTAAEPGVSVALDSPVFPRFQASTGSAIRSAVLKILKRAEITPWPNLLSNGRKSAITDLLQDGQEVADVAAWLGNSSKTIWEYYAMATGENRRRAAGGGRVDGRRTATQTGKHRPEDPSDLWTSLWTHQDQSLHLTKHQPKSELAKRQPMSEADTGKWAIQDSNL